MRDFSDRYMGHGGTHTYALLNNNSICPQDKEKQDNKIRERPIKAGEKKEKE